MRFITANVRHRLAPADVRRHLDLIAASSPDVIGLQEMGGRRPVLTEWAADNGYQLIMPDVAGVSGESSTPLLIRAGIPILASGGIKATDATTVPAAAAGPRRYPPKWVTWADLPGVRIYCLHMPASLYLPKMRALAVQVAEAVSEHAAGQMRVVVMGDFNTTKPLDLFDLFDGLTDVSAQLGSRPTLRRRDIDRVLYSGTKALRQSTISGLSDHRARLVDLDITLEEAMPKPYDLTTYDGKRVDWITRQALEEAARILNYDDGVLTITQGSYNAGGVSASAGTHDGGGVVDLRAYDGASKVKVLRSVGFAAWYRSASEGPWPDHIHAVLIGNEKLSPSAQRQVDAYLAGRNGLANNGPDNGPREYVGRRWTWRDPNADPSRGGNIDTALNELDKAAKHAERTKQPKRLAKIRAAIESLLSIKTKG